MENPNKARILCWDCETSPLITYTWKIWEANAIEVIEDWQMLCFSWRWLGEKTIHVLGQDDFKGYKPGVNNDKKLIEALRQLFDEADVIVAHNGNSFDQKKAQARMMIHGLPPPSPYKQIDTKLVAKRYGAFTSNKLDDLGKDLSIGQKLETGGFATWKGCLAGDPKAWAKMKRYNKQDVALLEEVYLKLRPWMSNHPAINLLNRDMNACPICGKGPMTRQGTKSAKTTTYQQWKCKSCNGWSRSRAADKVSERVAYVN